MNEHESLISQLENLAENSQPGDHFVDSLESQLRTVHLEIQAHKEEKITLFSRFFSQSESKSKKRKRKPVSPMRWIAAILALVIIGGLFLTIPPLRETALSVKDYFFPPEQNFFQTDAKYADILNYPDDMTKVSLDDTEPYIGNYPFFPVETFAEAYNLYNNSFLVLPEKESIELSHISAAFNAIYLIYDVHGVEYANSPIQITPAISLYQLYAPSGLSFPMTTVGLSLEENIRVRNSWGTYAKAWWSLWIPQYDPKSSPSHGWMRPFDFYGAMGNAHRLAWKNGDTIYVLTMSENLANSVDDVVAVAESLVPYVPEGDS